jgi:hypothetical protein
MNCAKCGGDITKLTRRCNTCGFDFGAELYDKFAFYFTWKDELDKLTELQNSLFSAIANVSAKIRRYEEVLKCDLGRMATTPLPKRKRKTSAKNKRR